MKETIIVGIIGLMLGGAGVYYWVNMGKESYNKELVKDDMEGTVATGDVQKYTDTLSDMEKQFESISEGKSYEQLVKSQEYQNWVKEVASLIEDLKAKGKEDVVNYIYYNFIGNMALKYLDNYSDFEIDLIVQSVRRIDFNTMTDKNNYTQLMKDYVDGKYYEPIMASLDNVNPKKLDTDQQYFGEIMLDVQEGMFYKIFKNRYDWNKTGIGFKPEFLENQFVDFLAQRFEQILDELGYDKPWFKKQVFSYYDVDSLKDLGKLIEQDFKNLHEKYDLESLGIPTDRFFRMDERRALFNQNGLEKDLYAQLGDKKEQFKKEVKKLRLKTYLVSYLGKEINLFNHKVRANYINTEWGPAIQNVFRVGRYVDEVMELDLKPEVK